MSREVVELDRDVAELPDGWSSVCVADALARKRGEATRKLQTPEYLNEGALPIVDQGAKFICGYTDDLAAAYPYGLPVIVFGDHTRTLKYVDFPFAVGADGTQCLHSTADFDDRFFFYSLQNIDLRSEGYARHFKLLKEQTIACPPFDEQRRIAEVLRSMDEAIAAADGVIRQLRDTRSHRLEALMALPGTYRRIDEVCRLSGGSGFPIKHQGKVSGRYPFAKVSDMNRPGNEVQMRHAENYVDDADLRTLKAKTFPVGTTFFPKVGATLLTNKRRIAAVEMLVDNNVMGAVAAEIDPWFLYYAFCTIDMADYVQPGAVPSVNQRTIGQIMIPVPDRATQEEFVEAMRDLDAAIEMQSGALAQLTAAKQALMSDLLSGRVRVPA